MEAGPYVERKIFDPQEQALAETDGSNLLGVDARMPWEIDGRKWHTVDRRDRRGEPVHWEGRILEEVIDRIEATDFFQATQWNSRSIVEVTGTPASRGWFLHAITAETWILKLKFRVPRGHFKQTDLHRDIPLATLNERDDLPVYGNEPRVRVRNVTGNWQEIEIRAHDFAEIDVPGFWKFLDEACRAFAGQLAAPETADLEEAMPWKKLGRKWHLSSKGMPPGKKTRWKLETLEEVFASIQRTEPEGDFVWNLQTLVHHVSPRIRDPWVTVTTKRPESILVAVRAAKETFALGKIAKLGTASAVDSSHADFDVLKLNFDAIEQVLADEWLQLLAEAFESMT
ncbi:MAG: hypothetical protein R3B96_23205 [Pirellulaceae bacterium]